mmetsp:Transcript_98959/g.319122  ORF Transcript_98959/g.319122 Transcript_98959/m.319122 type:complete len:113 (-) Transcript_98959:742-1080(-)
MVSKAVVEAQPRAFARFRKVTLLRCFQVFPEQPCGQGHLEPAQPAFPAKWQKHWAGPPLKYLKLQCLFGGEAVVLAAVLAPAVDAAQESPKSAQQLPCALQPGLHWHACDGL